jgi:predicted acetyltransferase
MRIIHFEEFIKNVTSSEKLSFVMEVEDEILVENKGIYLLEFDEEKGCVKRTMEKPQVKVNAKQLVNLFFDRMSKEEMHSIIVAEDKKEILEKLNKVNKYNKVFINDVV